MKLVIARLLLHLLAWLPGPVRRGLARGLGGWLAGSRHARCDRIEQGLALAFPALDDARRQRLAAASVRALAATALECAPIWIRSQAWIQRRIVRVVRRELVERPLRAGRGVLVLGGHLGNWELSILYGNLTLPIAYLYKPPRDPALDRELTRLRSRFEGEMIPTGGPALRRALRQLRGGGALGLLFDQLPRGGDSVSAPFFGHPVASMTLPHRLIQATGCAVVMGHCLRLDDGRGWKIVFDEVPGANDPDPQVACAAMNAALETAIRRAPEQYLWSYPRFDALATGVAHQLPEERSTKSAK